MAHSTHMPPRKKKPEGWRPPKPAKITQPKLEPRKGKRGRSRVIIDLDELYKLAAIGCVETEIASFFGCSVDLLSKRKLQDPDFKAALERGRDNGRQRLRQYQWAAVEAGNITMMIWLGKQMLGQRDFREAPPAQVEPADTEHVVTLQDDTTPSVLDG